MAASDPGAPLKTQESPSYYQMSGGSSSYDFPQSNPGDLRAGLDAQALDTGNFTLRKVRDLGKGEFGVVYEAVFSFQGQNRAVAVKQLRHGGTADDPGTGRPSIRSRDSTDMNREILRERVCRYVKYKLDN